MTTYSDLAARLNAAAAKKDSYSKDLLAVADAFTREVERTWQSGGKVLFGTENNGIFVPGTIGEIDDNQASTFKLAVEFEVGLIPRIKAFPVSVQKTRHGVLMVIDSSTQSAVDADQPSSFIPPINELTRVFDQWVKRETEKTDLAIGTVVNPFASMQTLPGMPRGVFCNSDAPG